MEGHLKCSLEIPHSRNYREIGYKLSTQGGLGSLGSPTLFEASGENRGFPANCSAYYPVSFECEIARDSPIVKIVS